MSRWPLRSSLGVIALAPSLAAALWLELGGALVPRQAWTIALGLPAGVALLALSTLVTARKGARFAARQLLATLVAPLRSPPPPGACARLVLAATGEELLFRLLGLWLLGQGPVGVALTSLAFAAAHLAVARTGRRLVTTLDAALCGLALAALYLSTGGLLVAALAHALRNLALGSLRRSLERSRSAREAEG